MMMKKMILALAMTGCLVQLISCDEDTAENTSDETTTETDVTSDDETTTEPFELVSIVDGEEVTQLEVEFSGDVSDPEGLESAFTIHVTNTVIDPSDESEELFDQNLEVSDVQYKSTEEKNILIIELAEQHYQSDTLFVSFDSEGLTNLDNEELVISGFSEQKVDRTYNLVEGIGDFEDPGQWDLGEFFSAENADEVPTLVQGDDALNGTSLKLSSSGATSTDDITWSEASAIKMPLLEEGINIRAKFSVRFEDVTLPPGLDDRNEFTFWLFPVADKVKSYEFRHPDSPNPNMLFEHDLQPEWAPNNPNMWYEIDETVQVTGSGEASIYFRTIGDLTCYIDDLRIYVFDPRPYPTEE